MKTKTLEELYPDLLNKETNLTCHVCQQPLVYRGNEILCGYPERPEYVRGVVVRDLANAESDEQDENPQSAKDFIEGLRRQERFVGTGLVIVAIGFIVVTLLVWWWTSR